MPTKWKREYILSGRIQSFSKSTRVSCVGERAIIPRVRAILFIGESSWPNGASTSVPCHGSHPPFSCLVFQEVYQQRRWGRLGGRARPAFEHLSLELGAPISIPKPLPHFLNCLSSCGAGEEPGGEPYSARAFAQPARCRTLLNGTLFNGTARPWNS